jgi:biopolymer transport protein ExbB/TolQ
MWRKLTMTIPFVVLAEPAMAYIGPGIGVGMIATVLGILTAIALAIFAVFWYPLKRLYKKMSASQKTKATPVSHPE